MRVPVPGILLGGALALAALAAASARPSRAQTPEAGAHGAFAGSETCLACHEDAAATLVHVGASHADAECESCHGPGQAHADAGGDPALIRSFDRMSPDEAADTCLTCHAKGNARFWRASPHARHDLSCVTCHEIHREGGQAVGKLLHKPEMETCFGCHALQRTQIMKSSHMPLREGKMSCGDCHNPHGSPAEALLRDNSIQENCYRCHADKRGPLLFEHPPVRENCLNCHLPHGSMHENLLVTKRPRLCQNCHIASRHPSEPRDVTDRFVFNQSCQNCHTAVHGSNHPSGIRQMR